MSKLDKLAKQYVLNCIDLAVYDESADSAVEAAKKVVSFVMVEADHPYNRHRLKTDQAIIADHIAGLPSYFNVDYTNHNILKLAVTWGSLPADFSEKQAEKIVDNFFYFIAGKLQQIARGYHVKGLTYENN